MSLLLYVNLNIFINLEITLNQGRDRGKVNQCPELSLGLRWDASRGRQDGTAQKAEGGQGQVTLRGRVRNNPMTSPAQVLWAPSDVTKVLVPRVHLLGHPCIPTVCITSLSLRRSPRVPLPTPPVLKTVTSRPSWEPAIGGRGDSEQPQGVGHLLWRLAYSGLAAKFRE